MGNTSIIPSIIRKFSNSNNDALALMPNMVNSLLAGGTIVIPKPFGPMDSLGNDVFETDVSAKVSLTEKYIDDWDQYHAWYGEIHCGTNVKRTAPTTNWW